MKLVEPFLFLQKIQVNYSNSQTFYFDSLDQPRFEVL